MPPHTAFTPTHQRGRRMAQEPYKHQAWPSWRYDPETGEGAIFESEKDVPKGYVDSLTKVGKPKRKPAASKTAPKAKPKAKAKSKKAAPAQDAATTLESLKISREDAEEILTEEDVEVPEDATDDAIAALVKDLLEDEDSE